MINKRNKVNNKRQYVIQGKRDLENDKLDYAIKYMEHNKAFRYLLESEGSGKNEELLNEFIRRYRSYRSRWRGNPGYAIENKLGKSYYQATNYPPLNIDIEVAAICDLDCPFCYRQSIVTPDKLMDKKLVYRIIDQCKELEVHSIKFNWRGEPLLHPNLPDFIDYAKKQGILETGINTNAVTLTESKSKALIEAGLDIIIYSFDGATKDSYKKMRPGRFKENCFEKVYGNIRRFAEIRNTMGSPFPRTKIQMVLTEETYYEQDEYFKIFSDCVDDVAVKAYTERGGNISDVDSLVRERLVAFCKDRGLPLDTPYWRDMEGNIFVSRGSRPPCEQIFQRLFVSCNGMVCMCCYDWGCQYPVGCLNEKALEEGDKSLKTIVEKIKTRKKGYEGMSNAKMCKPFVKLTEHNQHIKEIWAGEILGAVRQMHVTGKLEDVPICKKCKFKETYQWEKLDNQVKL